jgi:mannosyl-oligosaccharide alpha-1,2-mannosidase
MLPAIRFRRYRVFLVLAAIITILLIRFSHTRNGDPHAQIEGLDFSSPPKNDGPGGSAPPEVTRPEASGEESKEAKDRPSPPVKIEGDKPSPAIPSPPTAVQSVPDVVLPDRKIASPAEVPLGNELSEDGIHAVGPPGRQEFPTFTAVPTTIHWEKQVEHFPVPTESIIGLPTGLPATIPKIQHTFNDETPDAKINRETRQLRVREEFSKAWSGYKEHAWLHDELAPVSGNLRDPFCGWAATLVDSLDALYIMGLHEDFEKAVRAVNEIDFTTSPRADIPVFETTIRYLGGLLAAYDVSGGKYGSLLSKAEELAEILMGAFDTPNRMPVLFYRWKPTFASQPHRASQRSNLAELGSLSMEFTRLAQLTKNPRYYDAVARVTNALEEFQDRTQLRGVFPENVDASGCNRTVPLSKHEPVSNQGSAKSPGEAAGHPEGYQPSMPKTVAEPRPIKKGGKNENAPLELQILPGEPGKAKILGWGDNEKPKNSKRDSMKSEAAVITPEKDSKEPEGGEISNTALPTDPKTGLPLDLSGAKSRIGQSLGDWDCTPQGLEPSKPSGSDKFSMGGGQDSTYEYFPKVCNPTWGNLVQS